MNEILIPELTVKELRSLRKNLSDARVKCYIILDQGLDSYIAGGYRVVAQATDESGIIRYLMVFKEER